MLKTKRKAMKNSWDSRCPTNIWTKHLQNRSLGDSVFNEAAATNEEDSGLPNPLPLITCIILSLFSETDNLSSWVNIGKLTMNHWTVNILC
jgi:hypothetical protein